MKPRYHTQKELINARAKAMLPDPSFDVDGDGVVSSTAVSYTHLTLPTICSV